MTNRTFVPILLAGLLVGCAAGGGPVPASSAPAALPAIGAAPAPAPRIRKLVALGASDVVGVGADRPETEGWAPALAAALPGGPDLVRLGISGALASEIRAKLLPQAIASQADVAVLITGINDLAAGVPADDLRRDLDALLAGLRGSGARVLVVSPPEAKVLPAIARQGAPAEAGLRGYREAIAASAAAHGAEVVDLAARSPELLAQPSYISPDGLHPSTAGYQELARILAAAIAVSR